MLTASPWPLHWLADMYAAVCVRWISLEWGDEPLASGADSSEGHVEREVTSSAEGGREGRGEGSGRGGGGGGSGCWERQG